ncbi:MAG TPA: hypothetical protein VJK26_00010 [Patescibacteria group bacterium]|nr:hypothetical protein [Patescibacteria group bacterium]
MKKIIYLAATAFLGLILSFIGHAVLEIVYLNWLNRHELPVKWTAVLGGGTCALPPLLIYLLPILGIIGGIFLGLFWWQKVYEKGKGKGKFLKPLILVLTLISIVGTIWTINYGLSLNVKILPTPKPSQRIPVPSPSMSPEKELTPPTSEEDPIYFPLNNSSNSAAPIEIKGDETCRKETLNALSLLEEKANAHYQAALKFIGVLECAKEGSGMFVWETPPRYKAGEPTRSAGTMWYAGTFPHEACHSKQYQENRSYNGEAAEAECLQAQHHALEQMGAPQETLDYVKNSLNLDYWNIDYQDRWW